MIKKILYYSFAFICVFFTLTYDVNAEEVDFSTNYYYADINDITSQTGFRSGTSNSVTLFGMENYAPTYDNYEYLTGLDHYINYSVSNGNTYTIKVIWNSSSVGSFSELNFNNRLNGLTYVHALNGTISYQKTTYSKSDCFSYSSTEYCTYNFVTTYTFTATTNATAFRVGTYNTSAYSLFGAGNYLTQLVRVTNIDVQLNADDTLINQNEQIIDQNQTIIDQNNQTNENLEDINDNITDDNVTGVEESFSQFEDFLDDNSTITQLITLPVTLYTSILNGVSNSCTPFNLGNLYGQNLTLPCINIGNYLGSTLWGMIDLIISGFAIYSISKKLIKVFNNFSSMKDGDVIDD